MDVKDRVAGEIVKIIREKRMHTTGTAGKVFSAAPAAWAAFPKPAPITDEIPAPHCACCAGQDPTAFSPKTIAAFIDHTLLRPQASAEDIRVLCEEAKQHGFAAVCVNPGWVLDCARHVRGTKVRICAVIGFPLGATTTVAKVMEARDAVANGACELDMVMNVGALKSKDHRRVAEDIRAVRTACQGKILKVILETCLLTKEEIVDACHLARQSGADFVKTSTGFSTSGATVEDVRLMRATIGPDMGVKASGGIRSLEFALELLSAGATRLGTSSSVDLASGRTAGDGRY